MVAMLNLPIASPLQNPGVEGLMQGMQVGFQPLQMRAQLANLQSQQALNQAHANYWNQYGNLQEAKAQNMPALLAAQAERQDALANLLYPAIAQQKNVAAQQTQALTQPKVAQLNAQAAAQQSNVVRNQATSAKAYQDAINNGFDPDTAMKIAVSAGGGMQNTLVPTSTPATSPQSTSTAMPNSPSVMPAAQPTPQPQLKPTEFQAMGNDNQPITYDNSKNFGLWDPSKQDEYIANNNKIPPLPKGTYLNLKPDPKTVTKINALPVVAPSLAQVNKLLNDPETAPYLGKGGPALMANVEAQFKGRPANEWPAGYIKAHNLYRLSTAVFDTLATTQTGSRAFGPLQQFNEAFNPQHAISQKQAQDVLKALSQTLYDEGKTYVGQNYIPGLRQTAFNGIKSLQQSGLVDIEQPSSTSAKDNKKSSNEGVMDINDFSQQYRKSKGW